jgi:hypothetical protein
MKTQAYRGGVAGELMSDRRRVRREYEEFKVRIDSLFSTIRKRSDAYNAKHAGENATWMADGTHWAGAWFEPAENHRRGQHQVFAHYTCLISVYNLTAMGSNLSGGRPSVSFISTK